jgi:translation elongation factor EF-4
MLRPSYGGDISRKRKLLEKTEKEKQMRLVTSEIPQKEAFMVLKFKMIKAPNPPRRWN